MSKLRLRKVEGGDLTMITARRRKKDLGVLVLHNAPGKVNHGQIAGVEVHPNHRRKGLATAMYQHAQREGIAPVHNSMRTDLGEAWAKGVGGHRPDRRVIKFAVKRPKGKLRKIKTEAVNATHRVVNAGAGPTPTRVVMQSFTPLRALVGH